MHIRLIILSVLVSLLYTAATAQSEHPLEVGAQFTILNVDPFDQGSDVGVGVRASYDLPFKKLTIAPELEFNDFPGNLGFNLVFGKKQLLAGTRVGIKNDQFGFFLKVRPGLVHFDGPGSSNTLAVDVGGVVEYYILPRVALRLDWGDTMIRFPKSLLTGTGPKPAGWYHNEQGGFGVSFRF